MAQPKEAKSKLIELTKKEMIEPKTAKLRKIKINNNNVDKTSNPNYGKQQKEDKNLDDILETALDEMEQKEQSPTKKSESLSSSKFSSTIDGDDDDDDIKSDTNESIKKSVKETKATSKAKATTMRSETKAKYAEKSVKEQSAVKAPGMPPKNLNIAQRKEARGFPLQSEEKEDENLDKSVTKRKTKSVKKDEKVIDTDSTTEKIAKSDIGIDFENEKVLKFEDVFNNSTMENKSERSIIKELIKQNVDKKENVLEEKQDSINKVEMKDDDQMRSIFDNSESAIISKKASGDVGRYYHDEAVPLKSAKDALSSGSNVNENDITQSDLFGMGEDNYLNSVIANANKRGKKEKKKNKFSSLGDPKFKFSEDRQFKPYRMHMNDERAIDRSNNAHLFGVSILMLLISAVFLSIAYMGYKFIKNKAD